ncbi:MAG: hypothetical protein V1835_04505 [Candidatus Micrarchaeota archaeon]
MARKEQEVWLEIGTGFDPTTSQWSILGRFLKKRRLDDRLVVSDLHYVPPEAHGAPLQEIPEGFGPILTGKGRRSVVAFHETEPNSWTDEYGPTVPRSLANGRIIAMSMDAKQLQIKDATIDRPYALNVHNVYDSGFGTGGKEYAPERDNGGRLYMMRDVSERRAEQNRKVSVGEISRVLKPGGVAYIGGWRSGLTPEIFDHLKTLFGKNGMRVKMVRRELSRQEDTDGYQAVNVGIINRTKVILHGSDVWRGLRASGYKKNIAGRWRSWSAEKRVAREYLKGLDNKGRKGKTYWGYFLIAHKPRGK